VLRVAVAVDAMEACANWTADMHSSLSPTIKLNLGIACHAGNSPSLAHSLLASPASTPVPTISRVTNLMIFLIGNMRHYGCHVPFFGKVSGRRQLPRIAERVTLTKKIISRM